MNDFKTLHDKTHKDLTRIDTVQCNCPIFTTTKKDYCSPNTSGLSVSEWLFNAK